LDYLTKPFQPPELRMRVAVMLRQGSLLAGRDAHRHDAGKHALMDPLTGAYSEAFLEAHLDLLLRVVAEHPVPVALLGAGCYDENTYHGQGRDPSLQNAAALLNSTMGSGEALCRVAERTFVMVLPGFIQEMVDARIERIRQAGFTGALASLLITPNTPTTTLLRRLSLALQRGLTEMA
jgi:PleD family two-component response regulator